MFTRLGRHYAWATPDRVADLSMPAAAMYLRGITQNHFDEQLATLKLGYSVEALIRGLSKGAGGMPDFLEWLPPSLNPFAEYVAHDAPYTPELVAAWSEAIRRGVASNYAFARLDAAKLRKSGWGRR